MEASLNTDGKNGATNSVYDSSVGDKKGSLLSPSGTCTNVKNHNNNNISIKEDVLDKAGYSNGSMPPTSDKRFLRDRTNRQRFPLKVRQKRQTMQNMTRPLKHWLCEHRTNPYPTRFDKEILARDSRMSLVQVSNWFANARRRLKSTVKGEDLSWSSRVKMYNSNVTGNAELLSISSEDSCLGDSDLEDDVHHRATPVAVPVSDQQQEVTSQPMDDEDDEAKDVVPSRSQTPCLQSEEHVFVPSQGCGYKSPNDIGSQSKFFKQTILQRYLSDTYSHSGQRIENLDVTSASFNKTRSRRPSGSIGSRDYEEMSTSSGVSLSNDSYSYYSSVFDDNLDDLDAAARRRRISGDVRSQTQEDIHWKEISAAMALTSLARSRRYPVT